jgi:hypothetical protein
MASRTELNGLDVSILESAGAGGGEAVVRAGADVLCGTMRSAGTGRPPVDAGGGCGEARLGAGGAGDDEGTAGGTWAGGGAAGAAVGYGPVRDTGVKVLRLLVGLEAARMASRTELNGLDVSMADELEVDGGDGEGGAWMAPEGGPLLGATAEGGGGWEVKAEAAACDGGGWLLVERWFGAGAWRSHAGGAWLAAAAAGAEGEGAGLGGSESVSLSGLSERAANAGSGSSSPDQSSPSSVNAATLTAARGIAATGLWAGCVRGPLGVCWPPQSSWLGLAGAVGSPPGDGDGGGGEAGRGAAACEPADAAAAAEGAGGAVVVVVGGGRVGLSGCSE